MLPKAEQGGGFEAGAPLPMWATVGGRRIAGLVI
jgi:hypothetical protein